MKNGLERAPCVGIAEDDAPEGRAIERASYRGSYKGVTDLLTKYLWPEAALWLTRLAAWLGLSPNMVTTIGAALCIAATVAFAYGFYWTGLALGLVFMVLDTVDGKLARCTITSTWWGNVFDHGMDLVHPPFWWWAWVVGLPAVGLALPADSIALKVIIWGYILQRLEEGGFEVAYKVPMHMWRRFDSWFRLITARRNPNLAILTVSALFGRPDIGIQVVAVWVAACLVIHTVQIGQAMVARRKGPLRSWLR